MSGKSVCFATAPDEPIDARAYRKDGESSARDGSGRPMKRSLADVGIRLVWREEEGGSEINTGWHCRSHHEENCQNPSR
jgi:hypothetical protein